MVFSALFEKFVEGAPACVMYRALMENIFAPDKLDAVFEQAAKAQYTQELLFSTLVDLVGRVACRMSPSTRSAYLAMHDRITVSVQAVYEKLAHVELQTCEALVRYTAGQVRDLIDRCHGARRPLLKGYRTRILDGNHLGKTDHRLKVLRNTSAGALPGQSLVLLDPMRELIEEVILCENGHAQERTMLGRVTPLLARRDLLIADRNFCTVGFLFAIKSRRACMIIRQHGHMPFELAGKPWNKGVCATGRVHEQGIALRDPATGRTTNMRRITIRLKAPTRNGNTEIHLVTNLPAKVTPPKIADLYSKRWRLEHAFNELTTLLKCELNTLGYPKAALFSFAVAVCSYNTLAALKGAMREVHGEEVMQKKVSNYYLTNEIQSKYGGMMVVLPPPIWKRFQRITLPELAKQLTRWARTMDIKSYPKQPRGPKPPKAKLPNAKAKHVPTSRLLEEERLRKKQKPKQTSKSGP